MDAPGQETPRLGEEDVDKSVCLDETGNPEREAPRLFIEDYFPVEKIGIESVRERAAASALPALYFLHVWWARRPLVASAAAILGSLLPAWTPELAKRFPQTPELRSQKAYKEWFLNLCGVWGDPVEAKKAIDAAKVSGERLPGNGYGYKQAYKNSPATEQLLLLHEVLEFAWGRIPEVLDPTAGGGSIPYEALRYRLPSSANDLNPVAVSVLKTGLEISSRYGSTIEDDLRHWGKELVTRLETRLSPFFAKEDPNERVVAYIYARTVPCPRTGKVVPLLPNLWLRRGKHPVGRRRGVRPVAVRLVTRRGRAELAEPVFELAEGQANDFDPDRGTVSRGKGVSPWDNLTIDSSYIKAEAQAGRMGELLYAVAIRTPQGRDFRLPTATDTEAQKTAELELKRLLPDWKRHNVLPTEPIPEGNDKRPHNYGMRRWRDMFTPRQLLAHGCFVEEWRKISTEMQSETSDPQQAEASATLLALMGGKAVGWNSRQATWHVSRQTIAPAFSMHAFPIRWTFAEFEAGSELFVWTLDQLLDAYGQIAELLHDTDTEKTALEKTPIPPPQVTVTAENAGNLTQLPDGSQTLVCIDPPYYDNVMYAELSDYFYVWQKRTLGELWPELYTTQLTNKKEEAVTNQTRFTTAGRRSLELADHDYTVKMEAIFRECHRVLSDDGVLTVMFTHKRAEAWDALGTSLMQVGFSIQASWPVHTESEHSLHQAKRNAATSTILLVCRKREARPEGGNRIYFDDIAADIRQAAIEAYERFAEQGLSGVDLMLSTYGPTLAKLSEHWPVHSVEASEDGTSRLLRPEEALDVARAETTRLLKAGLIGREADFDPLTDFVIAAWELFKARQFPYDEARKLALAMGGLDVDDLKKAKILTSKGGNVSLCKPRERLRQGEGDGRGVNRKRLEFTTLIDAVHTALYVVSEDGTEAAKRWLDERSLANSEPFRNCLQALLKAVPRSKNSQGGWNIVEAGHLDRLASSYFPDLERPKEKTVHELELPFGKDSEVLESAENDEGRSNNSGNHYSAKDERINNDADDERACYDASNAESPPNGSAGDPPSSDEPGSERT